MKNTNKEITSEQLFDELKKRLPKEADLTFSRHNSKVIVVVLNEVDFSVEYSDRVYSSGGFYSYHGTTTNKPFVLEGYKQKYTRRGYYFGRATIRYGKLESLVTKLIEQSEYVSRMQNERNKEQKRTERIAAQRDRVRNQLVKTLQAKYGDQAVEDWDYQDTVRIQAFGKDDPGVVKVRPSTKVDTVVEIHVIDKLVSVEKLHKIMAILNE